MNAGSPLRLWLFLFLVHGFAGCGAEPGASRADLADRGLEDAASRADAQPDARIARDARIAMDARIAVDARAEPDARVAPDAGSVDAAADAQLGVDAGTPLRYLALGDSYTIGESVDPQLRFPEALVARLGTEGLALTRPQIIARTGWSTAQLAAAIASADPQGPYALVTLLIGVNDQFRGGSAEAFAPELRAMLGTAIDLAGGVCGVVVVTIPDYGQTPFGSSDSARIGAAIDAFNGVVAAESERVGAAWVNITDISRRGLAEPELVARDGLHPSAAQYAEWVGRLAPVARVAAGCAR
jgi:lysophospholipase L1-like esterase